MTYVSVRNLERFQHYKKRRPPWVKLYTQLLSDEEFGSLSVAARLVFVLSLLLAADRGNCFSAEPGWMAVELKMPRPVIAKALAELLAHRYLIPVEVASNGASQSATPREQRTENREKQQRTTRDVGAAGGS